MLKLLRVSLFAVFFLAAGIPSANATPNTPTQPIETKYYAAGPNAVSTRTGKDCCDSNNDSFDIWYPTNLADGKHPVIVWSDGTSAVPSQYAYLLNHLASWGFVVIAPHSSSTGSGQYSIDAANFIVKANSDASSPFHGAIDTGNIGAMGHSQGASGALNALAHSNGLIKTAVTAELPSQSLCSSQTTCADSRQLSSGSIFYINGSLDIAISPSTQLLPWQSAGLQSQQAFYQATPASVSKVWGTLAGPNHNDIQGQPDCAKASIPCTNGVYGYLGYPTAWFMAQLKGDSAARAAFVSNSGEFFKETTNWSNQNSSIS